MKCKVCGAESGKYPLCTACNAKKEQGLIIKCDACGQWHEKAAPCPVPAPNAGAETYLYEPRKTLITETEKKFFVALKESLPKDYCVFPQINLASFVDRTDAARYRNELFRNVDFLITDQEYAPKAVVEINDQTHLDHDRKERDERVQNILEEAGIPLIKLWTSYGVNKEYIDKRIQEALTAPPVRKKHFENKVERENATPPKAIETKTKKRGCYVATCIYGSYDCPQVWTLRRYRDHTLAKTRYGRTFIRMYYRISPWCVKHFGNLPVFHRVFRRVLDRKVSELNAAGVESTPYRDLDF